jgi:hypothetical protein
MSGTGGLPPPRVDQQRQPSTPTQQPGSSEVVRARFVIVAGVGGGVFIYGGAGPGGLLSADTNAATDPSGNPVIAGNWVYGANGSAVGMAVTAGQPGLQLAPASVTSSTQRAEIFAAAGNNGAANEFQYMVLTSGEENSNSDAALQLFSAPADGSAEAHIVVEFGGTIAGTFTPEGYATQQPWTVLPLINGWANKAGNIAMDYRRVTADEVEIIGVLDGTAATSVQFATMPAGLRPLAQMPLCAVCSTTFAPGFIQCDTAGNLTLQASNKNLLWLVNGRLRLT